PDTPCSRETVSALQLVGDERGQQRRPRGDLGDDGMLVFGVGTVTEAPRPSRVGMPSPAVKLPSEAPPTDTPSGAGSPSSAANEVARANSAADCSGSNGGRLIPPSTVVVEPST